jgi:hypothetical protein
MAEDLRGGMEAAADVRRSGRLCGAGRTRETSRTRKALLREHARRAWEAEMKAARGALAAKFGA